MRYDELLDAAYEAYKKDWCENRGVVPEDVDEEVGIHGGECYVCRSEFEMNEFQESHYMSELLSQHEFLEWLRVVDAPTRGPQFTNAWAQDFSKESLLEMLERLVASSSMADRHVAACVGYGLERLVYDEAFQVRCECARQGYGVSILIHDPEPSVREALAKKGYALEALMRDENAYVRSAVVAQKYKLGELIQDENSLVRWNVARQEYGWDVLINDRANTVVREVKSMLKEKGLSLEDWIRQNPDKCHLPENRVQGLDAVIAEADSVRDQQQGLCSRQTGRDTR